VQVDPIKPKLNPLGNKHLKLKFDVLLSNFAFKFSLRRYTKDGVNRVARARAESRGMTLVHF
jgi:hypothetical protein